MAYIARTQVELLRGGKAYRFATLLSDAITVEYKHRHRRTGKRMGSFSVVEDAGLDKSTVIIRTSKESSIDQWGEARAFMAGRQTFRLLDRNRHLRRLDPADASVLADFDREIEQKKAELKAIRSRRSEAVEAAWDRAGKIDISELEEKANA